MKKWLAARTSRLVIYTKNHPIYTATFEDGRFSRYVFAYIDLDKAHTYLERKLLAKSYLLHIDAANYHGKDFGKPVIVECEGNPAKEYLHDDKIRKILVESKASGRFYLGKNDKVQLSYPSIYPRHQAGGSGEPITILAVGYGGFIKGYDVLYRIYRSLAQQHNIRLIIAGTFGHNFEHYSEVTRDAYTRAGFDEIEANLKADPNVTFGPVKRQTLLNEVFPKADIYVHFCRMETFGFSVLEALSFGLPVVSCHFRAIPEMVTHGENGFLVTSNGYDEVSCNFQTDMNDPAWADNCYNEGKSYIEQLITDKDLRRAMGARSLEKVRNTTFNTRHRVAELERLYDMYC